MLGIGFALFTFSIYYALVTLPFPAIMWKWCLLVQKSDFSLLTQKEWYEDIWLMTAYHLCLAKEDKKKKKKGRYRSKKWFLNLWDIVSMLFLMHDVIYWNDLPQCNRSKSKLLAKHHNGLRKQNMSKSWLSFEFLDIMY